MSTISKALPNPPANFSTTLSSGVSDSDLTIPLNSVSGLPTEGVGVIYAKDNEGEAVTGSLEFIHWTNTSGNNLTLSDTGDRGLSGSASGAQAHSSGDTFEVWIHPEYHFYDWATTEHNANGTHSSSIVTLTGTQVLTNKTLTSPVLNTSLSGTAFLDEDNMASDSATKVASQQSIKAYVDSKVSTDGWVTVSDTWTYASASTFTISGVDRTGVYTPGTKLKFTQTSAKYAVVVSSSFSTDTTVTIAVNTDYVIANAAITAPYYSYQQSPVGFPNFFTYAPTHTGFSSAPTGTFRYSLTKGLCWIMHGGDTPGASNSTAFTVTGPVVAAGVTYGIGAVFDNGSWQSTSGRLATTNGSAAISVSKDASGGTFTSSGNKTALFQFTYTW